ncbi:zinc-binding dehydrogenase [Nocardioides anomalus]|uniref:Zinc-binding dehydrogenase n=1 Tax=Nocardioides anomalus TaxID=2712223 RepID=A0A6G6WJ15_9ACTN|nr:zinc-binding dehydrogenase [Nocardioides anomalus]QIG45085.1 zinc-binding dehydrogenase [Nocardioides anomalus]
MRAAVLHAFGDLRVEPWADPVPAADEAVLAVLGVQPSITEAMLVSGAPIALHEHLTRRLAAGPVAFAGHEFCAVVLEPPADPSVPSPPVGTRVIAAETVECTTCGGCRTGAGCARPEYVGFTRPGAFAELLAVPARNLVVVPPEVSTAAAVATQPLVGALHAHAALAVAPGESVLVLGSGVMGLHAVQLARRGNAGLVAATSRSAAKRGLATRLGADVALTPDQADDPDVVSELTGGQGFDVVVETAGGAPEAGLAGASTLRTAARAARRSGRIALVSVLPDDARLPLATLREKALTLVHPESGRRHHRGGDQFEHALRLLARGDVLVDELVTHTLAGVDELPRAVAMTLDKAAHGAVNPPQVMMAGSQRIEEVG